MTISFVAQAKSLKRLVQALRVAGFRVSLRRQEQPLPDDVVLIAPPALWSASQVDRLVGGGSGATYLMQTEPFAHWLNAHGGLARVIADIEHVLMKHLEPLHQLILAAMLRREHYLDTARCLSLSRARFYHHRKAMLVALASRLNTDY